MKKILYTLTLLCTLAQGAWAEGVNYIYYKAIESGNQVSLIRTSTTASNPTVLTSTLLKNSDEDNLNRGWYVLNSNLTYGERIVICGEVHLILKDGCTLTAEQGIRINTNATLSIYAQSIGDNMGKLVAIETHHDKAAIGGNKNYRAGELVIHGGEIEATCKDGSKYAAGIGGGYGDGSGMKEITIYGGKVTAKGAKYGTGIGGGVYGLAGTITINGGTVTAEAGSEEIAEDDGGEHSPEIREYYTYHIPAMMGYGAGSKKEGTVTIGNGATVHLRTTNDYEDKKAPGIGCATLNLGSNLKVTATMYDDTPVTASSAQRVNTCTMKSRTLDIVPCTEHELDYIVTAEAHTAQCKHCAYTMNEAHNVVAPGTTCVKCGYGEGATVCTLAFPQTSTAEVSGYATAGFQAVEGQAIAIPECTKVPDGWKFVGWLKQSNSPASIEAADSETSLLQPGNEYTVIGDERFFARYRYDFTETWTWDENLTSASLTIKAGSGEDISLTPTVSDRKETAVTDAANGRISTTATYTHGSTTYTFSNTQTKVLSSSLSLGEDDNTAALTANDGRSMNVTLTGRTLYMDGLWNTLCLPFDVEDISGSPLKEATLKEFTDASFADGTLTLTFTDATSIKAGQAYLIKWTDTGDSHFNLTDVLFTGVNLANYLCDDEISADDSGTATVAFLGTYKKLAFGADDQSILFLGADNTLYYPKSGATIGA